jgi:glycosyltransferase involved in cell wall biosynthesis
MNQPLLHVMIPAYGKSPYLRQTLESAVKYLPKDVPITVLEDPSDNFDLKNLVEEFPRVEYLRNLKRLGIAGNFNESINKSRGLFTQICGSDDIFISNPLLYLPRTLVNDKTVAAIGLDVEIINSSGQKRRAIQDLVKNFIKPKVINFELFPNKKIFNRLMIGDWLYFPAILWRTNSVLSIKFSGEFHTAMDLDIMVRLISLDKQIGFVQNKILGYRRHSESASSVYAFSVTRIDEEIACHLAATIVAINKGFILGRILSKIALTVRMHAIVRSWSLLFSSPRSALKVLVKAISPIR